MSRMMCTAPSSFTSVPSGVSSRVFTEMSSFFFTPVINSMSCSPLFLACPGLFFSNKKSRNSFFNYCSGTGYFMFPRYHPHCVFLSGFPGENAHSFILNAYHGSAYLISCSDLMFSRPAPECSPLYVSSMLMLSVGDIGFLSDSAYGVSFTAFFILCIIAQQFYICKHLIFTDFI